MTDGIDMYTENRQVDQNNRTRKITDIAEMIIR